MALELTTFSIRKTQKFGSKWMRNVNNRINGELSDSPWASRPFSLIIDSRQDSANWLKALGSDALLPAPESGGWRPEFGACRQKSSEEDTWTRQVPRAHLMIFERVKLNEWILIKKWLQQKMKKKY